MGFQLAGDSIPNVTVHLKSEYSFSGVQDIVTLVCRSESFSNATEGWISPELFGFAQTVGSEEFRMNSWRNDRPVFKVPT